MAVLGTKIRVPDPGRALVPRPRLTEALGHGGRSLPRLVLVSAPPGFGKTTVLSQWLKGSPEGTPAAAWLSLDEGDNDPQRFLSHLVASLRTTDEVGTEATQLLEATAQPPIETVLTSVVNGLDQSEGQWVLVLDDYHVIESPEVHRAVTFLLDHLPPHTGLAIATRADPPLPLPRLRARGELVELRAADLRFTATETGEFLTDVMGVDLTSDEIDALANRTEGWVAGLQLAGLSLRQVEDTAGFVEAFTGTHRFVLDYLVDEVLRRQQPDIRRFLLDTAILRELAGPLCDALTGRTDGEATLERLDRSNLFVVSLDERRQWYRYHHLFADALRARLTAEDPGRVPGLHQAASEWYAAHGLLEDAVRHALAGGPVDRAAGLFERAVPDLRRRRQDRLMREWLKKLPKEEVRRRAVLGVVAAWTRLSDGDFDGVEAWLGAAERALPQDLPSDDAPGMSPSMIEELRSLPASIAIYRASVAQARGDAAGTVENARQALAKAGPDDHFARGAAQGFLGLAAWARGDLNGAVETFTEAAHSLHEAGHLTDELGMTVVLGSMRLAQAQPQVARRLFEQALEAAARNPGARLTIGGDLHVGLAEVLLEQGDLETAEEHLQASRALGETASLLENRHRWFVVMARLRWAQGDPEAALRLLDEAEPLYLPGYFPDVRPIPALRARIQIAQGQLADAWAWARKRGVEQHMDPTYVDEFDQLTLVRLLLAQHRADGDAGPLDDAAARLDRLEAAAHATEREASLTEIRTLRGLVHAAQSGVTEAGPSVREQAHSLSSAAYGIVVSPTDATGLSEREVEVLRLLATTLGGPEIARQLFVSVNTLRTHTKHIFTKLDVNTRQEAVRRARELGVI
ncbi:LuxR C-terminal-related transcriptional regulator [Intrasporangium sp.]|uniref:LuxR C-terminal-related transcriptional regulator n=1 Tax=Intrasporangium sp. TaxID=1925024 RepID=UPI00336534B4